MLRLPWSPRRPDTQKPSLSLALQGGGAHGAYTWGVLDRLLEAGIRIDGISGTSAGAMNAVALVPLMPSMRMPASSRRSSTPQV